MKLKSSPSRGFSLLEILVALGLFAIGVTIVLNLFPIAQRMRGEAQQKTSATFIAQRIVSTLEATLPEGIVATAPDWINNPSHCMRISLEQPSQHYLSYDAQGQPNGELTASEAKLAVQTKEAVSIATIVLTTKDQPPGMTRVNIIIGTPANLPDSKRQHSEFSLLLSTLTNTAPHDATPDVSQ